MIETIALALLSMVTIYYVYFITRVRIGLYSLRNASPGAAQPIVTVIVAARDEEKSIGPCLQSLIQQTYPVAKYEIIIIDDGSTDKTASIVRSFADRYSNIHLHSLPAVTERGIGRKPIAIAAGIDHAEGEIILTTDADCIAPPRWIDIMVRHFDDQTVFVAGPVAEQDSGKFFSKLEQLEFLGLITTGAGLIGSGMPIICNGANLAYRKKAFYSLGGFSGNGSSNDDESLMNRMAMRNIGRIAFAPESDSVIITKSSNTLTSFLRQRIRWANKRGHYEDKSILVTLVCLYLFFLVFFINLLLIPLEHRLLLPVIIAFAGKVIVDYFTLRSGARLFRQHVPLFHFIVAELLHVPYIVIAAAIGQVSSMQWKGRSLRR
ncbi:MAG: glycosyltransferase [Ignavibacteriae bacterium]|nr:MAG: glycosyltransferase [Ignavibacteriota bacterium]